MKPATNKQKNFIRVICKEKNIPVPQALDQFSIIEASGFLKGLGIKGKEDQENDYTPAQGIGGASACKEHPANAQHLGMIENQVNLRWLALKEPRNPALEQDAYVAEVMERYKLSLRIREEADAVDVIEKI